ncbi:MAG: prepilin-type N-terminal cleavage/methylation domain-containing protein [Candidatus Saccharimonadales bacterium]
MALIQKKLKKRKQKGYTIVEVMIVLSISTAIFATAVIGYTRQNQRTAFTNAVREVEVIIQDILNDVSTGYYTQSNDFTCTRSGSPAVPAFDDNPDPDVLSAQGTNQDCIFLGKAVNLEDANLNGFFTVYTLVGLRDHTDDEEKPSSNVENAANRIVPFEGALDRHNIRGDIDIRFTISYPGPGDFTSGALTPGFAVVSGFGNGSLAGGGTGGAGATTNQVSIASIDEFYNFPSIAGPVIDNTNLNRDIIICIQEAGGDRRASITIGSRSQTNIVTEIDNWSTGCGDA